VIICRTSRELGLIRGLGGNELMVISVPTVWEVHPWDARGGGAGYGSKEREGQRGGIGWVPCQQWCLGGHIRRWRELG
jgi:hypothetical protein